jgi:hypothetical protein
MKLNNKINVGKFGMKLLFFVTCGILLLNACDKVFLDVEGKEADLQGKWQLEKADTVFYNFQKNLFQYQVLRNNKNFSVVYGYYHLQGDTAIDLKLLIQYLNFPLDYLGWDTLHSVTKQDTLVKSFKIDELTSKKLILSSDKKTMSFRKF